MVVRLDDPHGNLVGLHRTWLDHRIDANRTTKARLPDGLPARKMLGRQGVAWFGQRDAIAIVVGEGVESVLSASEYGDESWPSWV
jgi:hypothetical protein